MVKTIQFDNYDEATVRKTVDAVRSFGPAAGPAEVSVLINSKRFTVAAPNTDMLIAQLNAIQTKLNEVK
jgi:hypothetical protein